MENSKTVETIIADDFLANKGIIELDANDIQKLKDGSDYIDGVSIDGKLDDLGGLAVKAVTLIKDYHPNDDLALLMLKIRVAKGSNLIMNQLGSINDLFCDLGDDISVMWGIEFDAPLSDEVRVCVLGGFTLTIGSKISSQLHSIISKD